MWGSGTKGQRDKEFSTQAFGFRVDGLRFRV